MKLGIHSIYRATEGEGVFIGTPQIFVRFQGCAIGCINCDSKDTWEFTDETRSMASVLTEIEEISGQYPHRLKRVSITGGDPLHPKHNDSVLALVKELKKRAFYINIEAAGTRVPDEIFDSIDYISFDVKTPSTGVKPNLKLIKKLSEQYQGKSQVKSVVADKKDFEFVYDLYQSTLKELDYNNSIPWILTPCYEPGEEFPKDRFLKVVELNENFGAPFRVIGQQHKWMYGPDKKDV